MADRWPGRGAPGKDADRWPGRKAVSGSDAEPPKERRMFRGMNLNAPSERTSAPAPAAPAAPRMFRGMDLNEGKGRPVAVERPAVEGRKRVQVGSPGRIHFTTANDIYVYIYGPSGKPNFNNASTPINNGGAYHVRYCDPAHKCFPFGNKLFDRVESIEPPLPAAAAGAGVAPIINYTYNTFCTVGELNDPVRHYYVKNYYYATADFHISYEGGAAAGAGSAEPDTHTLFFRVELKNKRAGGHISYEDMGLHDKASVDAFVRGLGSPGSDEEVIAMIQRMNGVKIALAREIVEETTETGTTAKSKTELVKRITINNYHTRKSGKNDWNREITFIAELEDEIHHVREMDVFCMSMMEGSDPVTVYYTYGMGQKGKYTSKRPYNLPSVSRGREVIHPARPLNARP